MVAALPAGHPRRRFVAAMCLYAQDVARGVLPGPYSDQLAELYARSVLLPDHEVAACGPSPTPSLPPASASRSSKRTPRAASSPAAHDHDQPALDNRGPGAQ